MMNMWMRAAKMEREIEALDAFLHPEEPGMRFRPSNDTIRFLEVYRAAHRLDPEAPEDVTLTVVPTIIEGIAVLAISILIFIMVILCVQAFLELAA